MNAVPEVPREWRVATLRTVCQPTQTWNPQREPRETFWYIDVSAVERQTCEIREPQRLEASSAPSRARKVVRSGDAIFATVRPTLRRVAFVPQELDNQIASTAFCVVRANPEHADSRFLYYLLRTDFLLEEIAKFESGASYPAVNDKDVLDRIVPIPCKAEQEKISAVLWIVQRAIEIEEKLIATVRELKQTTLRQLFQNGLRGEPLKQTEIGSVPQSWLVESIGAHHHVMSGGTPSRGNPAYWSGGTVPWVKTTEVDYCVIQSAEEHITQAGLEESAAKLLPIGTLLLAMYGQGVTRGKVAILGIEAACNQACAAIKSIDDSIDTRYLYHFLASRYEAIRQLAHGGQQQNLNLEIVRDLLVAFPNNKEEQVAIVRALDAVDTKVDAHVRKRALLQDLFKTLLHQLMTGQIRVNDLEIDVAEVVTP